jgi:hypothetical protein
MGTVGVVTREFDTEAGILQFPEFKGFSNTFETADATAVTVDGKKLIKAGTIWPANDETAKGVVLYNCDVTNGTASGVIVFEGEIKLGKIPAAPAAEAKTALPRITWFGTSA